MKVKFPAKKQNLERAKKLIKQAKEKNAKLIIIPSLFPVSSLFEAKINDRKIKGFLKSVTEKIPGSTSDLIVNLAMDSGVHILSGPIPEQAGPKTFMTSVIISPQGEILTKYRKIVLSEKEIELGLSSGREYVKVDLDTKYGILIEDDILTPEMSRILTYLGSKIILGTLRIGMNASVIRYVTVARAIENEVPLLLVGGSIELEEGVEMTTPTIIASPEHLLYKEEEQDDSVVTIDTNAILPIKQSERRRIEQLITTLYKYVKIKNAI